MIWGGLYWGYVIFFHIGLRILHPFSMHSFFRLLLRPWQRSCAIFRSSLSELPDLGDGIFTGTEPVQRQIFRSKMRSWRAGPLVCSLGWLGLDSGLNHCFGAGRGFQFWIELGSAKANLHPPVSKSLQYIDDCQQLLLTPASSYWLECTNVKVHSPTISNGSYELEV